jgi:drug/metabolite transporter (DMT)-like permease
MNATAPHAPASLRPERRLFGVLVMLAGAGVLSMTDAAGKWSVASYPLIELNFVRSIFAVAVLVPILWRTEGAAGWRTRRPWPHVGRGILLVLLAYGWFFALKFMHLADATAIGLCAPLFMTALSVPLLKEHVGWRRWGAVLVGFGGMLLIVRPGSAVFQPVSLLPVGAAFGYALYMVTNRVLSVTESMTTLTLIPQLAVLVVSAALVPFVWVTPTWAGFGAMALTGLAAGVGHLLLTVAFRHAPASLLAPLDYTALIWAIGYGWLLFGTLPDRTVLAGMALIVGAGLFIVWRARRAGSGGTAT